MLSLAVVAGLRDLMRRDSVTLETVAGRMRELGYPWRADTLSQIDRGTRRLSIEELVGLLVVARDLFADAGVHVGEQLMEGSPQVSLSNGFVLTRAEAGRLLSSQLQQLPAELLPLTAQHERPSQRLARLVPVDSPSQTEERLARSPVWRRLGMSVSADMVRSGALALWGQPVEAERDKRLTARGLISDPTSRSRTAGRITRELLQELAAHMERGDGGERTKAN